jgi:general secretion pathway protein A
MYEQFFGFRERPFDLTPDPRYLVLTESHREALSNLEYGIASRKGITLLIGEAGSGKTTVIRAAIDTQPVRVHCVHLHNPTLTRSEFAEMLAVRYELSDRARESKTQMLVELEILLRARHDHGETSVLVVDEAQSLPLELLEEIRLLANIETTDQKLLCVILAGQPELATRLNAHELRQLKQRVGLRCELRTLTLPETSNYIVGRIQVAGGEGSRVFTREAVAAIYEASRGIPRTISVIADNALLGGFAAGLKPVTSQVVREVCRDFDLPERRDRTEVQERLKAITVAVTSAESGSITTTERKQTAIPPAVPARADAPANPGTGVEPRPAVSTDPGPGQAASGMFAAYVPKRKRFRPFSWS